MFRQTARTVPSLDRGHTSRFVFTTALVLVSAAVVIGVPFPLNGALLAAPVAGLLFLFHPVLIPIGMLASVPVQDVLPVPGDAPITLTQITVVVAVAMTPLLILGRPMPLRAPAFALVVVLYITTLGLSLWGATDPITGYMEIYRWLVALLALLLVTHFIQTRSQTLLALAVVAAMTFVQGLYGALQAALGFGPDSFEIGMGFSRAYGTFGMPNSYAAYLEMAALPLIPVAFWSLSHTIQRISEYRAERLRGFLVSSASRRRVLVSATLSLTLLAGAGAGLLGIALSFSRGAWLGTVAALALIVVLMGRRAVIATTKATLVIGVIAMVGAASTVIELFEDRVLGLFEQIQIADISGVPVTDENFATVERLAHWQTAIAMWLESPWIGVGAGNFNERFTEFAVHPQFMDSQGHAHNYYLHALAESGFIGLMAYLTLLVVAVVLGWRAFRSSDPLTRAIGIGALGMTAALIVHNVFENLHVLNISVQIMAIWALTIVAVRWDAARDVGSTPSGNPGEAIKLR